MLIQSLMLKVYNLPSITTSDFLSALVITNSCLKYLQALTSDLQAEAKGIVEAVQEISYCLQDARDNITSYHSQWFKPIEQMLTTPLRSSMVYNR